MRYRFSIVGVAGVVGIALAVQAGADTLVVTGDTHTSVKASG